VPLQQCLRIDIDIHTQGLVDGIHLGIVELNRAELLENTHDAVGVTDSGNRNILRGQVGVRHSPYILGAYLEQIADVFSVVIPGKFVEVDVLHAPGGGSGTFKAEQEPAARILFMHLELFPFNRFGAHPAYLVKNLENR